MTAAEGSTAEPAHRAPEKAVEALLVTHDTTGPRRAAYEQITAQAALAFGTAYHLSGGADDDTAVDAGLHNALHRIVPGITAFALHHLGALLPDLTNEQWERLDQAAVGLDLDVSEALTGADEPGTEPEQPDLANAEGDVSESARRPEP
ncbi:hypothetical protein ACFWN1_16970 [Streptomyces sp. NPDC058459]|uniref:hypothetical protein n=1 Tax=Streptomyces sp. NPDC058459 TaxID=3346508 RepID=UPI0036681E22